MSRKHLESALVAGALIENGLTPCFRFTRIRFVRYCFPPKYDGSPLRTSDLDEDGNEEEKADRDHQLSSTVTATCTCPEDPNGNALPPLELDGRDEENLAAMLGEGDCEPKVSVGTKPCRLHARDYLRRHPWRRLEDDYAVHSVQFTGDARQLLAGSANTSVRVIQTADGSQRELPRPSKWILGMPVTAIRFMPPKLIWAIACNSHGEVFAFNPNMEGFETLFKEPQQTYALDLSPDGAELATGGVDRKIRIYTLQPGSVLGMPHEIKETINGGSTPAKSGTNKLINIHQITNRPTPGKASRSHYPGGRPDQIVDLTARPYVLTRCYGVRESEIPPDVPEPAAYAQGEQIVPPLLGYVPTSPGVNITEGHSMRVMALRYHPEKPTLLFSAAYDNLVKLWDTRLQTGPVWQIFGPHIGSPDGLDIEGDYLLTASWRARNSIELWDMRTMNSSTGKLARTSGQSAPEDGDVCGTSTLSTRFKPVGTAAQLAGQAASSPISVEYNGGPAEVIPISGSPWVDDPAKECGEYPYAAKLLPNRAVVAAGSGFQEVRVVGRDTLLPIARIPMDSVVQSMDAVLEGRYIGVGCSSGTVAVIGLA
ncbi:unnamed protein product [Calicophoron daubneyi]|uniref:Uncharacterized protein n=1 Tax=Calicophoron daubneyi TaxID=300641 RepID=A0AAV2TGY5_CALDB